MDAIVIDFFHWTMQGEFKFGVRDWPDQKQWWIIKSMELRCMCLSQPTVDESAAKLWGDELGDILSHRIEDCPIALWAGW